MKTAMQELREDLIEILKVSSNPFICTTLSIVIELVESKVEKEKEQIETAFDAGSNFDGDWAKEEQYYNETFKN